MSFEKAYITITNNKGTYSIHSGPDIKFTWSIESQKITYTPSREEIELTSLDFGVEAQLIDTLFTRLGNIIIDLENNIEYWHS